MQHEFQPTPFRPVVGQPVLRIDDRGRAAAARAIKRPLADREAVFNDELGELTPRDQPNIIINRPAPGEKNAA